MSFCIAFTSIYSSFDLFWDLTACSIWNLNGKQKYWYICYENYNFLFCHRQKNCFYEMVGFGCGKLSSWTFDQMDNFNFNPTNTHRDWEKRKEILLYHRNSSHIQNESIKESKKKLFDLCRLFYYIFCYFFYYFVLYCISFGCLSPKER